jgi:hypothetical protein
MPKEEKKVALFIPIEVLPLGPDEVLPDEEEEEEADGDEEE